MMQHIELQEFEDFIKRRNLVAEKYRTYVVGWVRRFFAVMLLHSTISAIFRVFLDFTTCDVFAV